MKLNCQTLRQVIPLIGLIAVFSVAVGIPAKAQGLEDVVREGHRLLDEWELNKASDIVERLEEVDSSSSKAVLKARYDFLMGNYESAHQRLSMVSGDSPYLGRLRDRVESSYKTVGDYTKVESEDSPFVFLIGDERDRVLIPYAREALAAAHRRIGKILGHRPEGPIRIEIYPSEQTLADISGLTAEDIRNSGTIALCKFNRLMITSPRALLQGYTWVDTLIHEYVHFVINRRNLDNVPIWLHEGLAKYLERAWRGPDSARLSPRAGQLLREELEADNLVTFEQMHPSMAKLPSQKKASLAFAEVFTIMEFLKQKSSDDIFERVLDRINNGESAKAAVAGAVEMDFESFWESWKGYLRSREYAPYPEKSSYSQALVFKSTNGDTAQEDELSERQTGASEFIKLGRMLRAKDRCKAAIVPYRKAKHQLDYTDHRLYTDMARCYRKIEEYSKTASLLQPVIQKYPEYVFGWLELGKSKVLAGESEKGIEYLREAARLNPFDPDVFRFLEKAYRATGNEKLRKRTDRFLKLVKGVY